MKKGGQRYRNADAVYKDPESGAKLYIGNANAARSESFLVGEEIFHIVNCQDVTAANFFEKDERFHYKRFPVSHWRREENVDSPEGVLKFFEEGCHAWIEENLKNGHNVMVHCLAGAHRAGTTGVSFMMRAGKFDVATAIHLAKFQRPIVDPFGQLLDLLHRLEASYLAKGIELVVALSPPPASGGVTGGVKHRSASRRNFHSIQEIHHHDDRRHTFETFEDGITFLQKDRDRESTFRRRKNEPPVRDTPATRARWPASCLFSCFFSFFL